MIQFMWRHYRIEALIGGLLFLLSVAFIIFSRLTIGADLSPSNDQHLLTSILPVFMLVSGLLPLLVGFFLGAPLVAQEVERGTHRLAWTQSITRTRWLARKLLVFSSAIFLLFGVLAAVLWWWSSSVSATHSNLATQGMWATYDVQATVVVPYALFALALGVALGTLIRKTVPATFLTLVVFLIIRIGIEVALRPIFLPPVPTFSHYDAIAGKFMTDTRVIAGAWEIAPPVDVDREGHQISKATLTSLCPQESPACRQNHGIQTLTFYQPAGRFWLFQGIEALLVLVLSGVLVTVTFWLLRRLPG